MFNPFSNYYMAISYVVRTITMELPPRPQKAMALVVLEFVWGYEVKCLGVYRV